MKTNPQLAPYSLQQAAPHPGKHYTIAIALLIALHPLLIFSGFEILALYFNFPDILRADAAERLAKFTEESSIIVPTYTMLGLTGFSQMLISIFLYSFLPKDRSLALTAAIFGVIAGLCQAIGFSRWVIVIPQLAALPFNDQVQMLELLANTGIGMLVGEYIANICWGAWLLLLGLRLRALKNLKYQGTMAIALSLVLFLLAAEQTGAIANSFLNFAVDLGLLLLVIWHNWLAISFYRQRLPC